MQRLAVSCRPAGDPAGLELLWRDLERRGDGPFFLSWDWIGTWLAEIDEEPVLLEGRLNGETVALGLFCPIAGGRFATATLRLHETGVPETDCLYIEYNGLLLDWRVGGEGVRQCLAALLEEGRRRGPGAGWDRIVIRNAAEPFAALLEDGDIPVRVGERTPSWIVDLAAVRAAGGGYPDRLSANTRYQLRRAVRLYEARGGLTLDAAPDAGTALEYLDALRALHQRTWDSRGGPGAFARPFFERFHRRLVATGVPRGTVDLLRVSAGGGAVGYLYNFRYRGTVHYYASGFAYEADNKARPGLVGHALAIGHYLADGAARYDFMAGEARYKESLGTAAPGICTVAVERPGVTSMLTGALRRLRNGLRD